jgi:hypothetical protein
MSEIDPITGMPEVPPGYFWRVWVGQDNSFNYYDTISVQLRKHEPRWWSKNRSVLVSCKEAWARSSNETEGPIHGYPRYWPMDPDTIHENIRRFAFDVYAQHEEELIYHQRWTESKAKLKAIVGDYPPKKL